MTEILLRKSLDLAACRASMWRKACGPKVCRFAWAKAPLTILRTGSVLFQARRSTSSAVKPVLEFGAMAVAGKSEPSGPYSFVVEIRDPCAKRGIGLRETRGEECINALAKLGRHFSRVLEHGFLVQVDVLEAQDTPTGLAGSTTGGGVFLFRKGHLVRISLPALVMRS